jgi:hypothetical protein
MFYLIYSQRIVQLSPLFSITLASEIWVTDPLSAPDFRPTQNQVF